MTSTPPEDNGERIWAKLRSRKVVQWGIVYVAFAWGLLQGVGFVADAFAWPAAAKQVATLALLIGLPIVLVLAWYHGDRGQQRVTATELTILTLLFLLGGGFLWNYQRGSGSPVAATPPAGTPTPAAAMDARPSIAVLPFENLSSDKENAYFAAGIQNEILTRLSKIGALKVISRTSTEQYASHPEHLSDIATRLGVANILEGSVQRIGDAARINVQLIRADTDAHLWAEIYDRKLVDIFSVQTEIATAIAQTLNAQLSRGEEQAISQKLTNNSDAYDAYLRSLKVYRDWSGAYSDLRESEKHLRQAVELDTGFAAAWALLSQVHGMLYATIDATETRRSAARAALDSAHRLKSDLLEVGLADAYYKLRLEGDYDGARHSFEQLQAQWPNNSQVLFALAKIAAAQGRWNDNIAYLNQVIELDPFWLAPFSDLATMQSFTRDYAGALRSLDEALAIAPSEESLILRKVGILQLLGRLDDADALLKPLHPRPTDWSVNVIYMQAILRRSYETPIRQFSALVETARTDGTSAIESADLHMYLGFLLLYAKDEPKAREQFALARDLLTSELQEQPESSYHVTLALVYAGLGDRGNALKSIERAAGLLPPSKHAYSGVVIEENRAIVWALLGDREHAIPELARLLRAPGWYITRAELRLSPEYDKLRGDPQFEALLTEDGVP